jgi:hypothetical protein
MDFKIIQSDISSQISNQISNSVWSDLTYLMVKETEETIKRSQTMINESKKILRKE